MALTDLTPAQLADVHEGIHTLNEAGRYDPALVKAHDLVAEAMVKEWPPKKEGDDDDDEDKSKAHSYSDDGDGKCKNCGKDKDGCSGDTKKAAALDPADETWMRRVAKAMVGFLKDEVDNDETEDTSRPFV